MAVALDAYGPYDAGAGANMPEDGWRKMTRWGIAGLSNGVHRRVGFDFLIYGDSSGMQIKVKTGECWIRGAWGESTTEKIVPVISATTIPGGQSRLDLAVLRNDFVGNRLELDVVAGAPAAFPTPPALTQNTAKWETQLGVVVIANNAVTTMAAADVIPGQQYTRPYLRHRRDNGTVQPIATANMTKVQFPTVEVGGGGDIFAFGTNYTDFQILIAGEYSVTTSVQWATSTAGGVRQILICDSDNPNTNYNRYARTTDNTSGGAGTDGPSHNLTVTREFSAGQKVSVFAHHTTGSNLDIAPAAGTGPTSLMIKWLGP
jgi:hypothetical protein